MLRQFSGEVGSGRGGGGGGGGGGGEGGRGRGKEGRGRRGEEEGRAKKKMECPVLFSAPHFLFRSAAAR